MNNILAHFCKCSKLHKIVVRFTTEISNKIFVGIRVKKSCKIAFHLLFVNWQSLNFSNAHRFSCMKFSIKQMLPWSVALQRYFCFNCKVSNRFRNLYLKQDVKVFSVYKLGWVTLQEQEPNCLLPCVASAILLPKDILFGIAQTFR